MRLCKVVAVLLCFLLQGCTISTTARLYNNTGSVLNIKQISTTEATKNFKLLPDKVIDLENWESDEFIISSGNGVWKYTSPMVAAGFTKSHGWGPFVKRITKVQIEKDGNIYLLGVDQDFPSTSFVLQPQGFPLKPETPQR